MNKARVETMLGFAAKAGKIVSGEMGSRVAIKKSKAKLVIIAENAAESTVKEFSLLAEEQGVSCFSGLSMQEMGMAIGKSNRSIIVVLDDGFAFQIRENKDH